MRFPIFVLTVVLIASNCALKKVPVTITGEIYIITEGRQVIPLAGSDVSVYHLADVEKMVDDYNLDVYGYLKQLPPKSFETVTADSQGRFSFTLPPGEYAVFAIEHRDVGGRKEFYQWLVKAEPNTVLSNNNLAGRGASLLPLRYGN